MNDRPKFFDMQVYKFGSFNLLEDTNIKETEEINDSDNYFDNALEVRSWIRNSSDKDMKVTKGVLTINSVNGVVDDNEDRLTLITGIQGSTLSCYIVNNTDKDFEHKNFNFKSFKKFADYPSLDDKKMNKIFLNDDFSFYLSGIPSSYVCKIFEFKISELGKQLFSNNKRPYLFLIEDYGEQKERANISISEFAPIALYVDKNDQLKYDYFTQGGDDVDISGEKTKPITYFNVNDSFPKSYPVNTNNIVSKKDTTCLIQYLIPDKSCKINFSLELDVDGKKMHNKKLRKNDIQIAVPQYSLEKGQRAYNSKAYEVLFSNGINESYKSYKNEFNETFGYDRKKWVEHHTTKH